MATRDEIRQALAGLELSNKPRVDTQALVRGLAQEKLTQESPLSGMQRVGWGFMNESAQQKYLSDKFGQENVSKNPETGKYQVVDPTTGITQQVDPKGFEAGDITEMIGKGLVTSAQIPGKALQAMTLGTATPISAGLSGLAETGRQTIGNILAGQKPTQYDVGEIAMETTAGALAPGAGKVLSGIGRGISKISQKPVEALKKAVIPKISKATGEGVEVSKLLSDGLQDSTMVEIAQNPYIAKQVKQGITENVDNLALKAKDETYKLVDDFQTLKNKAYVDRGVKDTDKIVVGELVPQLDDQIKGLQQTVITKADEDVIGALNNISNQVKKAIQPDGTMSFKNAKQFSKLLNEKIQTNTENGVRNELARALSQIQKNLTIAKNSHPKIKPAADLFKKYDAMEETLENLLKVDKVAGELNFEKKILSRYKDKGNLEFKRQLDSLDQMIKSSPEMSKYKNVVDDIKLAQVANDISATKSLPRTGWLGTIPGVGKLLKEVGGMGAEDKAALLASMAKSGRIKPEAMTKKIDVPNIPIIGKPIARMKARAALYGTKPFNIPNIKLPINAKDMAIKTGVREFLKLAPEDKGQVSKSWEVPDIAKDVLPKGFRDDRYQNEINSLLSYINKRNYNDPKKLPNGSTDPQYVSYLRSVRGLNG